MNRFSGTLFGILLCLFTFCFERVRVMEKERAPLKSKQNKYHNKREIFPKKISFEVNLTEFLQKISAARNFFSEGASWRFGARQFEV